MRKNNYVQSIVLATSFLLCFLFAFNTSQAQTSLLNSDSAFKAGVPSSGRLWGYEFGDAYYKAHSDSLARGGSNQYSGIPAGRTAFQSRRIYLGYDYNINQKFSTELLLAAEDNFPAFNPPSSGAISGDQLSNSKLSFYIKLANLRIKNVWKGTDLVLGQSYTPSFALLSEKIWNYRSIERTIADIRRTPSYDMGAALVGVFDPATKNFGYDVMVANGTSAKPEGTNFKWFYGDVYGWFLHKKLVVDFYADYDREHWDPQWHNSRQMIKGFVAYTTPGLTIGTECFVNYLQKDLVATPKIAGANDTLDNSSTGLSFYVHGNIIKNKLRFFARYDAYNPMTKVNNNLYTKYAAQTGNYNDNSYDVTYAASTGAPSAAAATGDETYKQSFITAGLDFIPMKNVHLMPNIWYEHYASQLAGVTGATAGDYDLVYRMTFFFTFGKDYSTQYYRQ